MEIRVFPQAFTIQPSRVATAQGDIDVMVVTIIDAGGTAVMATFALADWEQFKRAVADPVGEAERLAARARIVAPNGLAPTLREPKQ